jgi:hypothetical protein
MKRFYKDNFMSSGDVKIIIEEIINAHGGKDIWNNIDWIEADISARGFLFKAKHIRILEHVLVRAFTKRPHFMFVNFPETGQTGELIGNEEVRILGSNDKVLQSRLKPRDAFKGLRRILWWDFLDFIYFGGYATWNYLVTPFIFLHKGFVFENLGQFQMADETLLCFRITFPDDIPTHSRTQTFYFDKSRLLRRLDYTAEVVGAWAHAAHFCNRYRDFSGLKVATLRTVRPLLFNHPLSSPTLVGLEIHNVSLQ